jgi:hypothetical protein
MFARGREADEACVDGRQWEEREEDEEPSRRGDEEGRGGGCVLELSVVCGKDAPSGDLSCNKVGEATLGTPK